MRKMTLLFLSIASVFWACDDEDIKDYKEPLAAGGPVSAILVSPVSLNLYADSEAPKLSYICVPSNAVDTTVRWSSDNPGILDVDPVTGKLTIGTIRNGQVSITAVSNSDDRVKGACRVTVRNILGLYQYIDVRKELGFWILDRNVGATLPFNGDDYESTIPNSVGNYYHFGFNSPVANREIGGPDGHGGDYYTTEDHSSRSWVVPGGYPEFNRLWAAEGTDFKDWSVPENTPCPEGWRLPTKVELEKMAYMTDPANFRTAKEKGAASVLRKKLCLGGNGRMQLPGGLWDQVNGILWSSDWNPNTKKVWVLYVPNTNKGEYPLEIREQDLKGIAVAIRCVRDGNVDE